MSQRKDERERVTEKLDNALKMAKNIYECPCSEQHLYILQPMISQAIRDLAEAIKLLRPGRGEEQWRHGR